MTLAVLFPGQGVQRPGMGADLFDRMPGLVAAAEQILGYSLRQLCAEQPDPRLDLTEYSQPAIYVVNALAYRELGVRPDVVAGHSLGEYNALEAAGVFDFETGLRIVRERARLMSVVPGSMVAVMGLPVPTVEALLDLRPELGAEIAAINAPQQVVVSCPDADPGELAGALKSAGAMVVTPLRVSGPFHSRHMAAAAREFADFLGSQQLRQPEIPVIANRHARPHVLDDMVTDLAEQIDHTLLWQRSIERLLDLGASFTEVNGSVLTSFNRQIQRHLRRAVRTP